MSKEIKESWKDVPLTGVPWKTSYEYKTGDWRSFRPVIDHDKCITCLKCNLHCPDDSIKVEWKNEDVPKKVTVDYDYCKGCGICAELCPADAIDMVEEGRKEGGK